jgi:SgrR family transcriptional regulator
MSSQRLRIQFEILFEHYAGVDVGTQIEDITDILSCTPRNARIVLNKMEEQGWIEWHPAAGRGKSSQLIFKRSRNEVIDELARRHVSNGDFTAALNILEHDKAKFGKVIHGYFGLQQEDNLQVLRLPYYRPLPTLGGGNPSGCAEQYITTKVFSGLVRLDQQQRIQPDLAYRWQKVSNRQWRFYIRPSVRFHNGTLLTTALVAQSLSLLKQCPLFAHIESVIAQSDVLVDIYLSSPDEHLARMLTDASAAIRLTSATETGQANPIPIGTGPFQIIENDNNTLTLRAFDGYFGFRPLIDQIKLNVVDDVSMVCDYASIDRPFIRRHHDQFRGYAQLAPGCGFLLLNRKSGIANDEEWTHYLADKLSSLNIFRRLSDQSIRGLGLLPAFGLSPGWNHQSTAVSQLVSRLNTTVSLVYNSAEPIHNAIVEAMKQVLAEDNITLIALSEEDNANDHSDADLWLKEISTISEEPDALARWFINHSELAHYAQTSFYERCYSLIKQWRVEAKTEFNAFELSQLLVEHQQVIPLFHRWLRDSSLVPVSNDIIEAQNKRYDY